MQHTKPWIKGTDFYIKRKGFKIWLDELQEAVTKTTSLQTKS